MCRNDCRTSLWGGAGRPIYDAEGQCSCVCEDETWSNRNILGRAACVPDIVHKTFGWVGLGISVAILCHAAYHLRRQLKFHEQQISASSSPVERCRRQLHVQTITAASISIFYCVLVIEDALRWCQAVLAFAEVPAFIGGAVLAGRMWGYTNDPRLLRKSPKAVAISGWLERPFGNNVACFGTAIAPTVGGFLALAGFPEVSARVVMSGGLVLSVVSMVTFVMFGRSLLKAIDESLLNQKQKQQQSPTTAGAPGAKGGASKNALSEARKKVQSVVRTTVVSASLGIACNIPMMSVGLDLDMPLIVYGMPIIETLIWMAYSVQVHSGRSGSYGRMESPMSSGLMSPLSSRLRSHISSGLRSLGPRNPPSVTTVLVSSAQQERRVVPTEMLS